MRFHYDKDKDHVFVWCGCHSNQTGIILGKQKGQLLGSCISHEEARITIAIENSGVHEYMCTSCMRVLYAL